jgi:hypothetical protein
VHLHHHDDGRLWRHRSPERIGRPVYVLVMLTGHALFGIAVAQLSVGFTCNRPRPESSGPEDPGGRLAARWQAPPASRPAGLFRGRRKTISFNREREYNKGTLNGPPPSFRSPPSHLLQKAASNVIRTDKLLRISGLACHLSGGGRE